MARAGRLEVAANGKENDRTIIVDSAITSRLRCD
jgi:hypothetical protein